VLLEREQTRTALDRAVADAAAGRGSIARAVRCLCAGTRVDADALHRVTGGNPFFVTEILASPDDDVPVSVMEAMLARVGRLGTECREALDQLSVVPSQVDRELATALLGSRLGALAEAEL